MRAFLVIAMITTSAPVWAQRAADCAAQAAIVTTAAQARADGQSKRKTRNQLTDALGKPAARALTDWIYTLPPEHQPADVGAAYQQQCEAL